jgi:hypothetical protein
LGNNPELDVAMIGSELSAKLIAIESGFMMGMLVAGTPWPEFHSRHPELITVGSDSVNRLLERHIDFKTYAVKLDDLNRQQRKIRTQQDFAAPLWMDDENESEPRLWKKSRRRS